MDDGIPCLSGCAGAPPGAYFLGDLPADAATVTRRFSASGSPDPARSTVSAAPTLTSKVAILSPADPPRRRRRPREVPSRCSSTGRSSPTHSPAATSSPASALPPSSVASSPSHGDVTPGPASTCSTPARSRPPASETPNGRVTYDGTAAIDGVPGAAAAIPLMVREHRRLARRRAPPTGNAVDVIDGASLAPHRQRGMPCVVSPSRPSVPPRTRTR